MSDTCDAIGDGDRGQLRAIGERACQNRRDRSAVQRGGDDKRRDVLPKIVGDAGDRAAVVEREIAIPARRERQIVVEPQQVGDLRSPRVIPTEEDTVFPYRLAERHVVLDRVGRRIVAFESSAGQIVEYGIGNDLPLRGDRQILRDRVAARDVVPARKGISVTDESRERCGVFVPHRLRRHPVGQRSAVTDEGDRIGIAGIVEFQDERTVRGDGPRRSTFVRGVGKVREYLYFRRNRGSGRSGQAFGRRSREIVSRRTRVLQIVFDRIRRVDVGRPTRRDRRVPLDGTREIVVPPGEGIARAGGGRRGCKAVLFDLLRYDGSPAVRIEGQRPDRSSADGHGIERDPLAVLRNDQEIEGIVAQIQRNGFGRDAVDAVDVGADLPGRFRADRDLPEEGVGLGRVRKRHRQRAAVDGKADSGNQICGEGVV